ncbi:DoxX family protein [Salinirubrum litoreum]|uniref:DoxX family protein n=1 Tax=Salinirubrum litoreum TaxID=1126234 RepID=A0ABD5R7V3_9EURY|nr:DoxX family protein [Salinirubrum litoreum]
MVERPPRPSLGSLRGFGSPRWFALALGFVVFLAVPQFVGRATAHVRYVTPGADPQDAVAFLLSALTDPVNVALLGAGGVGLLGGLLAYLRVRPFRRDVTLLRRSLAEYRDLLPWLLRLAVGLPLVGAGFAGYFFSPLFQPAFPTVARLFGIAVGFLLLFGLATRLTAAVGLTGYLLGLVANPDLLLAVEYVPGFLAIILVGGGRPSADGVIARLADDDRTFYSRIDPFYRAVAVPFAERVADYERLVPVVLRVGLGVSFAYLGVVQKLANPGDSLAVVAKYDLTSVVPVAPELWVVGAGVTELAVGVALFVGLFTRFFSGVAFFLLTTTLFGLPDDPVLAHISVFGLVSALLVTGAGRYSVDRWIANEVGSDWDRESGEVVVAD